MSCRDGFAPPPPDEDHEAWHESDAEDWNPDSWRDGWPPTPEEEMFRKALEQGEVDGGS